jgi:hypothetical protein
MVHRLAVKAVVALVITFSVAGDALADQVVDGRFGPGALYRLVRPDNWNGRLLIYAHGMVSITEPVALPPEANLFVGLVTAQNFAIAYSSFSENGWAVKDGAQRTHQLLGIFTSTFGRPARVYVAGASMGGLIAIKLTEDYPAAFAGALPACAAAGGTRAQFDYLAHVRALFDVAYPNVLPGNAGEVDTGIDILTAIVQPAVVAMAGDGGAGALAIASIDQTPVPFTNGAQLVESMYTALGSHAGSFSEFAPKLPRSRYFDNQTVTYTSGVLPAPVMSFYNGMVGRFAASPSALNYMAHYYRPSGALAVPMVMLSTSHDPVLPGFHQAIYSGLVAAAGNSDFLVQRTVPRYGHCNFTPAELATAFSDLVAWVEGGIKPAP